MDSSQALSHLNFVTSHLWKTENTVGSEKKVASGSIEFLFFFVPSLPITSLCVTLVWVLSFSAPYCHHGAWFPTIPSLFSTIMSFKMIPLTSTCALKANTLNYWGHCGKILSTHYPKCAWAGRVWMNKYIYCYTLEGWIILQAVCSCLYIVKKKSCEMKICESGPFLLRWGLSNLGVILETDRVAVYWNH